MTASVLARVVQVLQERQIPFALIGAAAMAAQQALAADGIDVDVRHGDDDDPLLGVVRCTQGDQVIDLVIGRSIWQREVVARATPTQVFSLDLPIVTVEDLILLKLYAGGIQDRWDIQQLLTSSCETVVIADIEARMPSLPERSQELWRQLRST